MKAYMCANMKAKQRNIQKSYVFADPMYIFSDNGSKARKGISVIKKIIPLLFIVTNALEAKTIPRLPRETANGCFYKNTPTHP